MPERLLSLSEVLLFGRVVEDILIAKPDEPEEVAIVTIANVDTLEGLNPEGQKVKVGERILVAGQDDDAENGIYTVTEVVNNGNTTNPWDNLTRIAKGRLVRVKKGGQGRKGTWKQLLSLDANEQKYVYLGTGKHGTRGGENKHLEKQLGDDAQFARIYGFSFEGTYYELPNPTLFLVHGEGDSATEELPPQQAARAPFGPSRSGVASADYQMASDIRVWAYDKADYTIRMDAMTGMIEQVLLDIYFGFDSPAISGAKVSGAKVSGAKVSGAKVSGAKVSGAKVSGAKAYGGGD